jgi:DNA-binding NarL/FixJ family response regulator
MQTQVIICDKQIVYAMGCSLLIKDNPQLMGYHIIKSIEELTGYIAYDKTKQVLPMVLVVDSAMFHFGDSSTMHQIKEIKKRMGVMVVFNEQDEAHLYQLIDNGISVIVARNVSKQEWSKALEMARLQKIYFCNRTADKVFNMVNRMDKVKLTEKVHRLHTYDKYILLRICEEASSKQIAYEVGHSKRTIEGHRTKMMQQLEVKNLAGLVKAPLAYELAEFATPKPALA